MLGGKGSNLSSRSDSVNIIKMADACGVMSSKSIGQENLL